MLLKKFRIYAIFIFLLLSCEDDKNDCSAVLCLGSPSIGMEIIADGSNVFSDGNYSLEDITMEGETALETNLHLVSDLDSAQNPILFLQNPEWAEGNYSYTLLIGNDTRFELKATFIELEAVNSSCCGNVAFLQNLEIDGTPAQMGNGIFIISLD
ncbi:hypothetical protein HPE56_05970 [Maribacter sp. ANRC-HE7]|uniref:Uncharacterized protein n=1 Tax=Maribacter aquimaris TaxID=2737171 RepID=A0ABR7V0U1_9FLAO|nr:hypothetical protein [Maribacter aquimaris]MBD0777331.1 hypothetical protein [Maribacter aquimaris]